MARATHTNHAKCTVWTPTMKAEISGPRSACALELFRTVDLDKMGRLLAEMTRVYEDRKAKAEIARLTGSPDPDKSGTT